MRAHSSEHPEGDAGAQWLPPASPSGGRVPPPCLLLLVKIPLLTR